MKKMKKYSLWLMILLLIYSCETDIDLDLPEYKEKIVVEGIIENGKPPMVLITKSIPYFSEINSAEMLEKLIINDAKVTITSDKGELEVLTYGVHADSPLFFAYTGFSLKGTCDTRYKLTIEYADKTYESETYIPNTFELDSIWIAKLRPEDTTATVRVLLNDDGASRDYYQFKVKVKGNGLNDRLWAFTLPLTFDDATFNGLVFNYEILRATPSSLYAAALSDEEKRKYWRGDYRVGDTIYVKRSLMDYDSYRFWSTAMSEISFGQSTFMSPPPIQGNIKCNTGEHVLGSWCGFASKEDTVYFR